MQIWDFSWQEIAEHCYLALGNFDGVHLGHQELIRRVVEGARKAAADSLAVTFDPHPAAVLQPAVNPGLLTTRKQKLRLMEAMGVDGVCFLPFTPKLAALSPEAFVEEILWPYFRPRMVVVGFNFTFGYRGMGTPAFLQQLGSRFGFEVQVVPPVKVAGKVVSSTAIRASLEKGDVATASLLLGRWPALEGTVTGGDCRGRHLGFPTANLRIADDIKLPKYGVYACRVHMPGGAKLPGLVNIGCRPTFGINLPATVEVHILNFDGNLYGTELEIELCAFLRQERRFGSESELRRQINNDIIRARKILEM
ncbi:MAG: riboflavin kinase / adenylyltransferase [Clostridia bacterium]|nr:riboflavin kinase / adenylyltransferase [Clostridia bacterium]